MKKEELSANINTLFSATGLKHTLHLYTPNVSKYAIQTPFLDAANKDEKVVYVTSENPDTVRQGLKGLDINLSVIKPDEIGKIKGKKMRIVVDAGSINLEEQLKMEKHLSRMGKANFILCTYDVSKLNPEMIKDLVKHHDKLMLTTSDVTVLSSESFNELNLGDEVVERFVKNDLDTIVLALILERPMCGTDIIKTIHKNFNVLLSPGTIYPLLHSLEKKGLLKCEYEVKTKTYKPGNDAEPKIRSLLNEHVQTSRFLSRFLSSVGLKVNTIKE